MTSPLIVIVGETASGKSALAMEIAEKYGGEIICADSRTVYRGMDIGTAKPTPEERRRIPHHVLDVVNPDESFTVADFKQYAQAAIDDITARNRLPVMVGGTGLYIDAILYDYVFRAVADPTRRAVLNALAVDELQSRLLRAGIALPKNDRNPRHLIRALETDGQQSERKPLRAHTLVLGLRLDRNVLTQRVHDRIDAMVAAGFIDEVRKFSERYGWDVPAMQAPGYKAFKLYLAGEISLEDAKLQFAKNDLHLAKRQRTWFRRNNSIQWSDNRDELLKIVDEYTSKLNTY